MLLWFPLTAAALLPQTATPPIEHIAVRTGPLPVQWLQSPAAVSVRHFSQPTGSDALSLLQGIAGIQADVRSNTAQDSKLSLRGFGSRSSFGVRGLRMTLDGIPLTTPDGQTQPSSLLSADLAAVSILKGPFAALYGNAAGGVIAWESTAPDTDMLQLSQQQSGSMRQQRLRSDSELGTLLWQQTDLQGIRPHNRATRQAALWKQRWQLSDDLVLNTRLDWSSEPRLDDPGALTPAEWLADPWQTTPAAMRFDSHKNTRQQQLGVSLQSQSWQLSSYLTSRHITQFLMQSGEAISSAGGVVDLSRQMLGLQWQQQLQWQQFAWQWSLSHEQSRDDRLGYVNQLGQAGALRRDDSSTSRSQDAALRASYQLSPDLALYAGARWSFLRFTTVDYFVVTGNPDDSGRKNMQGLSHALGLQYMITPEISWHASTGRGFESPTLTEMAYQRSGSGLNLQLVPAQNRQWDSGLKWQHQSASGQQRQAQLDLFYLTSRNELVVDSSSGGRTVYKNAAGTHRQGVEFSVLHQWAQRWQLDYSLTWLDAVYTGNDALTDGRQMPGVAAQQQQIRLQYAEDAPWSMAISYRYLSRVAADDNNQVYAPGYGLLDVKTAWIGQRDGWDWRFELAAQNLTNQQYVGAVVVNQSSGRAFEPGMPRQLSAGLQLNFRVR